MIDIHTHILPGIDDGSPDIETSIKHLKIMRDARVSKIVCTPHYISNFYENNKSIIQPKLDELQNRLDTEKIDITLYKGAEILLNSKSVEKIQSEKFNINGGSYVLVESEMTAFPADFKKILFDLVVKGYKPILAHPERYAEVKQNPAIVEDFMHRDIYIQINAGSLLNHYGKESRKAAWELLGNGWVHFMASDNHCKFNDYTLPIAAEQVRNKIDNYTAKLLTETNPAKMLNNENIEIFYISKINREEKKSFFDKFKFLLGR